MSPLPTSSSPESPQSAQPTAAQPHELPARPQPEPIRFYKTSWVDHSAGYLLRRFGLGLAAALLATVGAFGLWLGYGGLRISESAGWLRALVVAAFVLCSAMAYVRTWGGYARPADGSLDESAFRSIKVIGFVGVLLAYAVRSAVEAPGERLRRMDYDAAVERFERLTSKRSGNPARRTQRKR